MRVATLCLVGLAVLTAASGTAVATENTPPLAAAGLDQTVPPNTTVYLDASGSVDPDGEITGYQWTVDPPSGTTTPACDTCRRTEFDADTVGRYTVTLTVTDDDGATRSDTLYVTVETDGPTVTLTGPTSTTPDSQTVLTATASADNASLRTLAWVVDGDVLERETLSGSEATRSLTRSFNTTGEVPVSAVAYDTRGRRGTATRSLTVGATGGGLGTGNGCGPDGDTWAGLCTGGGDALISVDGKQYILDSNGEEGIQLPSDSGEGLRTYSDPTSSESINQREPGSDLYVIADGVGVSDALDQTDSGQEGTADTDSPSLDNNNAGVDDFDNDEDGVSRSEDSETITDTTKNVLTNIGITVTQRQSIDSSDDNGDSSDSDSGDDEDDTDDRDTGNDESEDNGSNNEETNKSKKTKSGSKGGSDKGGTSGKRVTSSGFVGL